MFTTSCTSIPITHNISNVRYADPSYLCTRRRRAGRRLRAGFEQLEDRALLAGVSAAVLSDENVKKMKVE